MASYQEVTTILTGGDTYEDPFVGEAPHSVELSGVDITSLSNVEIDSDGMLKPGIAFTKAGLLPVGSPSVVEIEATGAVAGAVVATGVVLAEDELLQVYNLTTGVDLTAEFSISADDEIDNAGGTSTVGGTLRVTFKRTLMDTVYGVVREAVKVAAGNTAANIAAGDAAHRVVVFTSGQVSLAQVEANYKTLLAGEKQAYNGSNLVLIP